MSIYGFISKEVTIYIAIPMFITGIVGNFINARIFYTNNLRKPTTFLLFLLSCSNILYLHLGLLFRILAIGFNTDISILNVNYCKIRYGLLQLFALTSLSCIIYTIIDQFLVSSFNNKWRHLSRISSTRKVIVFIVLFWIIYSIPLVIFSNIISNNNGGYVCTIFAYNLIFGRYASYFNLPFVWAIIPICLMLIFGILTYQNIGLLRNDYHRGRAQRQLTSMILLHVIVVMIGMIPFAFFFVYLAITLSTVKSPNRQALESLLENIVTLISYFSLTSSFFIYYFSSRTHREQVKKLLHLRFRENRQVIPKNNINF